MAKVSAIAKNNRRKKWLKRVKLKELSLRAKILILSQLSDEERDAGNEKLQKMPRDTSRIRVRNRCEVTGRPRDIIEIPTYLELHLEN